MPSLTLRGRRPSDDVSLNPEKWWLCRSIYCHDASHWLLSGRTVNSAERYETAKGINNLSQISGPAQRPLICIVQFVLWKYSFPFGGARGRRWRQLQDSQVFGTVDFRGETGRLLKPCCCLCFIGLYSTMPNCVQMSDTFVQGQRISIYKCVCV